jgi:predicted O-methyltransferase YrrM
MITLDQLRELAKQAVENIYPHDGLRAFMESTNVVDPYYSFLYRLSETIQPDYALETGVELGRGLYSIAAGCPSCDCVGVELHGRVPDTWLNYVGQLRNTRIVSGTNTIDFLLSPANRKRPIDLFHADSDHSYEVILAEICLVLPMMRSGSVIVMDDVCHDGPRKVFDMLNLPKIEFTIESPPALHGANGYGILIVA